jgi:hypothetical protein
MSARIVTFTGNHGQVDFAYPSGALVAYRPAPDADCPDAYADYVRADFAERRAWYAAHGATLSDPQPDGDIVDISVWLADSSYLPAENDWRLGVLHRVMPPTPPQPPPSPSNAATLSAFVAAVKAHLDACPAPATRKATVTWDALLALLPKAESAAQQAAKERAELTGAIAGMVELYALNPDCETDRRAIAVLAQVQS